MTGKPIEKTQHTPPGKTPSEGQRLNFNADEMDPEGLGYSPLRAKGTGHSRISQAGSMPTKPGDPLGYKPRGKR